MCETDELKLGLLTICESAQEDSYCVDPKGRSHHAAVAVVAVDVQYIHLMHP